MWLTLTNTWACDSVSLFCCKPVLNPLNTRKLSFVRMLLHSINQVNFQDFQGCTDENTQSQRHMWKSGGEKWIEKTLRAFASGRYTTLLLWGRGPTLFWWWVTAGASQRRVMNPADCTEWEWAWTVKNSLLFAFCLMHQTAYWTRYSRGFRWAVWM